MSDVDMNELEENMINLENIIAAGTSASNKRNSSKKWVTWDGIVKFTHI